MKIVALALLLLMSGAEDDRVLGHVLGTPVLESQIKGLNSVERESNLRRVFIGPLLNDYLEPHRAQWQLTENDIHALIAATREAQTCVGSPVKSMPPGSERMFAQFVGASTKIQRFIYEHNGGGRILLQQAGAEAFDATRTLLLRLEREGKLSFADEETRSATLKYWLADNQPGLLDDPGVDKAFKLDYALVKC